MAKARKAKNGKVRKRRFRSFRLEEHGTVAIIGVYTDGRGDWTLWHLLDHCQQGDGDDRWHNYALECPPDFPDKSVYRGGWNGQRLAKRHDAGTLQEQEPALYAWLIEQCEQADWQHYDA